MEALLQNIRFGARNLRRHSGFAITAVVTLAIGIGLATAVFTVADAMLLRRLPVVDQDRIVVVAGRTSDSRTDNAPLGFDDAREFGRRTRSLERVALFGYEGAVPKPVRVGNQVTRLQRSVVSGDFFSVLASRPIIGRALNEQDDGADAAPVVVLSYHAWRERFNAAPNIIGRRMQALDGGPTYTIVGVMPEGLDYPRGTEMWMTIRPSTPPGAIALLAYNVIGRLAPGRSPSQARDEMTAFFHRAGTTATQHNLEATVHTLPQLVLGDTGPAVVVFVLASALLLLLTCVNVANLLLVRGLARVHDVAIRTALGASRKRVASQLLTEHALLAVCGGILGLVVAIIAIRGFIALAPVGLPRLDEIHVSATVLVIAVAVTATAMLLFALAPAIVTSRVELQRLLRSGTRQTTSRRARMITDGLVVGQLMLAVIVLSAAALLAHSLIRLERADLGLNPSNLFIGDLALRYDQYDDAPKQLALLEQLLPAIQSVPGVRAVSPVVADPFSGSSGWDGHPAAEGQSAEDVAGDPRLNMEVVSPAYFRTMGLRVLRGREFTDQDRRNSPNVVILSQSAAQHYWPGDDPIGKRIVMQKKLLTVVGVVPDTRYRDLRVARPSIYFPLRQSFFPFAPTSLAIRTDPAVDVVPAIRRVIGATASGVQLASVVPFETLLETPLAEPRLNALLLAIFAGAAVTLAGVGLFGVMMTMVHQRTPELGVRMALGATASDIVNLVLRRGMALAMIGTLLGVAGALAANRLLAAMLFEVSPTDAMTLGTVALFLLGVAAIASLIPARWSARIDPVAALRAD